jgi:hypothetical protein
MDLNTLRSGHGPISHLASDRQRVFKERKADLSLRSPDIFHHGWCPAVAEQNPALLGICTQTVRRCSEDVEPPSTR